MTCSAPNCHVGINPLWKHQPCAPRSCSLYRKWYRPSCQPPEDVASSNLPGHPARLFPDQACFQHVATRLKGGCSISSNVRAGQGTCCQVGKGGCPKAHHVAI